VRAVAEAGGAALFIQTDVARVGDVEALVARTLDAYGRLDCACNSAGTVEPEALLVDGVRLSLDPYRTLSLATRCKSPVHSVLSPIHL